MWRSSELDPTGAASVPKPAVLHLKQLSRSRLAQHDHLRARYTPATSRLALASTRNNSQTGSAPMPRLGRTLLGSLRPLLRPSPCSAVAAPFAHTTRAISSFAFARPSLLSSLHRPALSLTPFAPAHPSAAPAHAPEQKRHTTYGAEYQPSQVRRKRKHGFLRRKRSRNGRKTLEARWAKGRKYLSH